MIDHVYYTGFLVIDRERDVDLDTRATRMMNSAAEGKVVLYQRRIGPGQFEYHCRSVKGT